MRHVTLHGMAAPKLVAFGNTLDALRESMRAATTRGESILFAGLIGSA